jgi:hypothetical protein
MGASTGTHHQPLPALHNRQRERERERERETTVWRFVTVVKVSQKQTKIALGSFVLFNCMLYYLAALDQN